MPPINLLDALRVVLFYLFLLLSSAAAAQSTQEAPSIRLLSRPQGDSIILRWAPVDYQTWSLMRQRGVVLERRVAGTDNWKSVTTDRLIAYQKEDFVELTDTDDPNIVAVAQALHGEVVLPTTLPEGPMGMARLKYDEQEQRYFLAALNADLSRKAAVALGWGWTDHTIKRGLPYEYRVRLLPKEQQVGPAITSETVQVRSTDNFPFGPVVGLAAKAGDEKITLSWPEFPNRRRYLGYYLEVSEDGTNFTATTKVPIIKTQAQEEGDLGFTLEVEDLENYLPRHYRLVGVNAFGERSKPGDAIVAMSVDLTPPAPLAALRAEDNHTGGFRLTWDFPKATDLDTRGYVIVRSTDYEGPYHPVNETALDPLTTEFTDPTPIPHLTNYYRVMTFDTAGNHAATVPAMALWEDGTPPAAPTGITGQIDTLGNVFLMWEAGTEPDLRGYRVYVSHARNREFLPVSTEIVRRNFHFDSTRIQVLNEVVHYKVVAIDNNYNASPYSEIITIQRPDRIPPSAALITNYTAAGNTVALNWQRSTSPDLSRQEVWRQDEAQGWHPLDALSVQDAAFLDTSLTSRTTVAYRIRSVDDVGLWTDSPELKINSGVRTSYPNVRNWARTQVQDQLTKKQSEVIKWESPQQDLPTSYQLYLAQPGEQLRPYRKLSADTNQWIIPPNLQSATFAIRTLYATGGRSPLSPLAAPAKK